MMGCSRVGFDQVKHLWELVSFEPQHNNRLQLFLLHLSGYESISRLPLHRPPTGSSDTTFPSNLSTTTSHNRLKCVLRWHHRGSWSFLSIFLCLPVLHRSADPTYVVDQFHPMRTIGPQIRLVAYARTADNSSTHMAALVGWSSLGTARRLWTPILKPNCRARSPANDNNTTLLVQRPHFCWTSIPAGWGTATCSARGLTETCFRWVINPRPAPFSAYICHTPFCWFSYIKVHFLINCDTAEHDGPYVSSCHLCFVWLSPLTYTLRGISDTS
jgi:hypothetical protein